MIFQDVSLDYWNFLINIFFYHSNLTVQHVKYNTDIQMGDVARAIKCTYSRMKVTVLECVHIRLGVVELEVD